MWKTWKPVYSDRSRFRLGSRANGFSLAETLFALGVLSLFVMLVFSLFRKGYQSFFFLQTRQSVQGQMLRIMNVMEYDFGLTHLRSVGIEARTTAIDGETLSRDSVSCLVLDDWTNPNNFVPELGLPAWNRQAVYRTSIDEEGRLERLLLAPEMEVPFRIIPLTTLVDLNEGEIVGRQLLATNLRSLSCNLDVLVQVVEVTLELEQVAGKRGLDEQDVRESIRGSFHWTPGNTVPKL